MNIKTKKNYNLDLLYNRFKKIYYNECDCNEGEFTDIDLFVVNKLIDFFKVHASLKEKRDILNLLNGEW